MLSTPIMLSDKTLVSLGLGSCRSVHYQLSPEELTEQTLLRGQGLLSDTGALCIRTGEFTGRSPLDKFTVKDAITENTVDWNNFNIPIEEKYFHQLRKKLLDYLNRQPEVWIRDAYACADPAYRINIRVINEQPSCNLFAHNMFLRPEEHELEGFQADWHIIHAPGFKADPAVAVSYTHLTLPTIYSV